MKSFATGTKYNSNYGGSLVIEFISLQKIITSEKKCNFKSLTDSYTRPLAIIKNTQKTNIMINSIKIVLIGIFSLLCLNTNAQVENSKSQIEQITETLMKYIDGTANGELDKLREAFHPDFNLYSVTEEDSLRIWSGKDYIGGIKEGKKSNRIGRIISIDYENDAAIAKAEILIPNWRIFTDYFLLVKYMGSWKIVHKSYTWREIPKSDE